MSGALDVAALWEAEYAGLRRFLVSRLGERRSDADDVLSDVFARVWTKRHLYRETPTGSPQKWLYQIAANLLIDYWRRWKPTYSLLDADGAAYSLRFDEIETRLVVADAIADLTERQQRVIVGRFYEGRLQSEYDEITVEGVKKLTQRAFVQMRKRLERAA